MTLRNTNNPSSTNRQHTFAVAEAGVSRERSTFQRDSRTLTAIDAGIIYPILVDEVLPGDTHSLQCGLSGVLSTPLRPFKDNLYVETHYFFCPNRLVWSNWQKFQGEKDNPDDVTTYTVPQIELPGGLSAMSALSDYMGIPTISVDQKVNALPFRMYNLIWKEYYRDQFLQDSPVVDLDDADSDTADYFLRRRGRRKDYLTGCLPSPQAGDAVTLSLGDSAPVVSAGSGAVMMDIGGNSDVGVSSFATTNNLTLDQTVPTTTIGVWASPTNLETDLTGATSITVNALRQSVAIQQLLELDQRGGLRYREQLKARFGVTTPDFRLQRPEYLGGGSQNISVTPVPGTNQANPATGVGYLGGFAQIHGSGGSFTHSFTEHGYIIGLVSMRADYSYQEGLQRHWSRETRYDYYEPALAHLGEQPVYNREIFVSNDANDALVWGYAERFSEYKYGHSQITSVMRSTSTVPIDFWHLGEEFGSLPTLGNTFIQENPPLDRALVVTTEPQVILDCYFANKTTRVMPVFNTPGLTRL